jgi:hypothetical protein
LFLNKIIYNSSTNALFGEKFNVKDTIESFLHFDSNFTKLFMGIDYIARDIKKCRENIVDEIRKVDFFESTVSEFLKKRFISFKNNGHPNESLYRDNFAILFASLTNTRNGNLNS